MSRRSLAIAILLLMLLAYTTRAGQLFAIASAQQVQHRWGVDVSCVSQDFCGAIGLERDSDAHKSALLLVREQGIWRNIAISPSAAHREAELTSIDCPSLGVCFATGQYITSELVQHAWAVYVEDGRVTSYEGALAPFEMLDNISCTSSSFCVAEGRTYSVEKGTQPHLVSFKNNKWQGEAWLEGYDVHDIDCYEDQTCVFSGAQIVALNQSKPVFGVYRDGVVATEQVRLEDESNPYLTVLQCAHQDCVALAMGTDPRVVRRLGPDRWLTLQYLRDVPQEVRSIPWVDMACPLLESCVFVGAVGFQGAWIMDGLNDQQAIRVQSPTKERHSSVLAGVTCASSDFCIAIGSFSDVSDSVTRALMVEYQDGKWRAIDPFAEPERPSETPPAFVAFGDSITTGGAIHSCVSDRTKYAWGCPRDPQITPYPDILQRDIGFSDRDYRRVGIWGYTVREAVEAQRAGRNTEGAWVPQLKDVESATSFVAGALGINDLQFSNVFMWLRQYVWSRDGVGEKARELLDSRTEDFDSMFESLLKAKGNGAEVILTLYYNPYNTHAPFCGDLRNIGDTLVGVLNNELQQRAGMADIEVADFRPAFEGHGAGSEDPFVLGVSCDALSAARAWLPRWVGGGGGKQTVAERFDPHPNQKGTTIMAQIIKKELYD